MNPPAIVFENVQKSYPLTHRFSGGFKNFILGLPGNLRRAPAERYRALTGLSFEAPRGQVTGIIGRNGCGKSTTLGLIAGVIRPDAGKVSVEGRVSPLLELGAGFHPDLTGRENIALNGVLLGLSRREVAKKSDSIVEFSELGEFIDQPIRSYSNGMMARLGFSVVANLDPEILLVDEVLAVGDVPFQTKCLNLIESFKKERVTVLLVSHSMTDVERLCDKVVWIQDGRVEKQGKASDVVRDFRAWTEELKDAHSS